MAIVSKIGVGQTLTPGGVGTVPCGKAMPMNDLVGLP